MNWQVFMLLLPLAIQISGYKVLFLAPGKARSHFIFISPFVRALLDRGHEVTYLTSNTLNLNLKNYTEILLHDVPITIGKIPQDEFIEQFSSSVFTSIDTLNNLARFRNTLAYESEVFKTFVKQTGLHFDIIVAEEFYQESFLMFAHKYKAPIVTICSFGGADYIDRQHGLFTPPSFVPHFTLTYSDNMSFTERWFNTIVIFYDWLKRNIVHLPSEKELAEKYFSHLAPLPPLEELIRNISIVLVNSHRAIKPPQPQMPSVIPIGGVHIKPPKKLPNDLQAFLDAGKDGVIYFSFGSLLQGSKMPKQFIQAFLDTFKHLSQRVLWKFEDKSLVNVPSNVMIRDWMPQSDVLAHPNVILFISHGGMLGTMESLYHGVPMLLIPFFSDQFQNAYRISRSGYGEFLNNRDVTGESLTKAIVNILSHEAYLNRAKRASAVFKDNLVQSMDESMFWIEYVAKFKGAKHLKSHAVNMCGFTYLLLDVLLVAITVMAVIFLALRILMKKIFQRSKIRNFPEKKEK